jgi:hypothetical protein
MDHATRTVPVPGLGIDFEVLSDDEIIGPSIAAGRSTRRGSSKPTSLLVVVS